MAALAAPRSASQLFSFEENANTVDPEQHNPRVFFDLQIGGRRAGRIVMELFADAVPRTAEVRERAACWPARCSMRPQPRPVSRAQNFRCLCTGERGVGLKTGKALHFKGTMFHRVIPGFMMQGGDFSNMNGTGGESIYGGKFEDENLDLLHNAAGILSMANSGKNANGSQFFITFRKAEHLDGKHVVFGRVVEGMGVVKAVETADIGEADRPLEPVLIARCGELELVPVEVSESESYDEDDAEAGASAAAAAAPTGGADAAGEGDVGEGGVDEAHARKRHKKEKKSKDKKKDKKKDRKKDKKSRR